MPTIKEALKLALDALQKSFPPDGSKYEVELEQKHREAIAAIQELLDRSVADPEPIGYMQKVSEALYENGDPVSIDAAELLERISAPAPKAITADMVTDEMIDLVETTTTGAGAWDMVKPKELIAAAVNAFNGVKP